MFYLDITEQDLELMRKIKLPKNKLIRNKKKLKKFNTLLAFVNIINQNNIIIPNV